VPDALVPRIVTFTPPSSLGQLAPSYADAPCVSLAAPERETPESSAGWLLTRTEAWWVVVG